jgi:hypothetical protein
VIANQLSSLEPLPIALVAPLQSSFEPLLTWRA